MIKHDAHVELYREGFVYYIWDAYKDLHGVRPRWIQFNKMSTSDLIKMADRLEEALIEDIERDRREAAELEVRIAEAESHPNGFVFNDATELDREYGIDDIWTYIPDSLPINSMMADAIRKMFVEA